jgi:thiol-disulfide isomerase/thioredoxin
VQAPADATAAAADGAAAAQGLTEQMQELGFQLPSRAVQAVDFDLADLAGEVHSLHSYRGTVVFLNFWATWCGPCRTEMPDMQELHDQLGDHAGFTMLAINLQEDAAQVRGFAAELDLSFQILLDSSGETSAAYGARTLPMSYIIAKDGSILARIIGVREWAAPEFAELFRALSNEASDAP